MLNPEKNSVSEAHFFNAPFPRREKFKQTFLKKATSAPDLCLPYKNFDIAKSKNQGISRLEQTKSRILANNSVLEAEIKSKNLRSETAKLFLAKNQENLDRIALIETAHKIQLNNSPSDKATFNRLNQRLYGPVDKKLFNNLLAEKKFLLEHFTPEDIRGENLKQKLLRDHAFKNSPARRSLKTPDILLKHLNNLLKSRYRPIFSLIDDEKIYNASEAQAVFTEIMHALKFDWTVIISDQVSIVTDAVSEHTLKLPKDLVRTGRELKRLAIHEIGVHTARALNGRKNGGTLLELGTKNYLRAEEGLATLCECAVEADFENKSFERISYRYLVAGLARGIDGKKRNAVEVFNLIAPLLAIEHAENGKITTGIFQNALEQAYFLVENAFRGTDWLTRGLVFLKLKIYYEGLIENIAFFEQNLSDLDGAFSLAMLGKYDHTKPKNIKSVLLLMNLKKRP